MRSGRRTTLPCHRARYGWSSGLIRRGVPVKVDARLLTHRSPAATSQTCIHLDATDVPRP